MEWLRDGAIVLIALLIIQMEALFGQSYSLTVVVPFSFTVADMPMPAGQYFIKGVFNSGVAIQNTSGEPAIIVMAEGSERGHGRTAKLVFHHYGNFYFLAQVQLPEAASLQTLATGQQEIEAAKAQKRQPDLVLNH